MPSFIKIKVQLLLTAFSFSFNAFAQELQVNNDQFTGDTTYVTTPAKIFSGTSSNGAAGEQVYLSFFKQKNLKTVAIMIQFAKMNTAGMQEGDQLQLKLKNGDTVLLNAISIDLKDNGMVNYGSDFVCFYKLEENNIQAMKKNPVAFISLKHAQENFNYALTGLSVERIKKAIGLIF